MTLCLEQPIEMTFDTVKPYKEDKQQTQNIFFYGLDLKHDRLFHISSAVKHILGYTPKEIMRNGLSWFVQQIDADDLKQLNEQADKINHSRIMPQIKYHFKTKTGTCCRLCEHRCLLHDSNGSPSFIIARVERV